MLKSFLIISFTIIRLNQWVLSKQISTNLKSSTCIYTEYLKLNQFSNGHTSNYFISSTYNLFKKACLDKRVQACFTRYLKAQEVHDIHRSFDIKLLSVTFQPKFIVCREKSSSVTLLRNAGMLSWRIKYISIRSCMVDEKLVPNISMSPLEFCCKYKK